MNNSNYNSNNDVPGLDEIEDIPYDRANRPKWTDEDHLCVGGKKQIELLKNEMEKRTIKELYEGTADMDDGIYFYLIKKDNPELVYCYHKKYERKIEEEIYPYDTRTGHSSLITLKEYEHDEKIGPKGNPECIVLYAGEMIYKKKDGITSWSPASGHFRPKDENAKKVGFPMDNFDAGKMDSYGGKRRKRRKRRKTKKTKKVRRHQGIIQTGGNVGRLRKGYRYSGKKLKSGLPQIIKCKSRKC